MDIFEVKLIEVPDLFKVSIITGTSIIVNSDNTYNAIAYNGQTFVIPDTPWVDSDGTPMTSPATTPIVCSAPVGCDVENSDGTYDAHVNNGATLVLPDTIVKNTAGTTILTQPSATSTGVIADSVVTNSDNTFSLNVPAEINPVLADITHIDSDLTPVVLPAMTPMVCTPAATPEGWYPPADWGWDAASALINDGDNGFVGLAAIYPNISNYSSVLLTFSGTGIIDWGDGTVEAITSGVKAQHVYNYSTLSSTVTTGGYKVAAIVVTTSSTISVFNFNQNHSSEKSGNTGNWIAVKIRSTYALASVQLQLGKMEMVSLIDCGDIWANPFFGQKFALQKIIYDPNGRVISGVNAFSGAFIYNYNFSSYNWSGLTDMTQMFHVSNSTQPSVLDISVPNVAQMYFTFRICNIFSHIKLRNTTSLVNLYGAFNATNYVKSIEIDDCSLVNDITAAFNCPNLEHLLLTGLTIGVNVANSNLSAIEINALLSSIGTAAGAQTINLAGNPGALTCDVSIGTAKGYTIITS